MQEIHNEQKETGYAKPVLAVTLLAGIVVLSMYCILLADKKNSFQGWSTQGAATGSAVVLGLLPPLLLAYFLISKAILLKRFCGAMCARGQELLANPA